MEEILMRVIYDYSIKNKILDSKILKKIMEKLIDLYDLKDYVTGIDQTEISISKNGNITAMQYYPTTKRIIIYTNQLYDLQKLLYSNSIFQRDEALFFINLYTLHIAIHELKHAEQYKESLEKESKSSEILKLCFNINSIFSNRCNELIDSGMEYEDIKMWVERKESLISEYYEYAPHERMAEIDSYSSVINISEEFKNRIPEVLKYIKNLVAEKKLGGYTFSKRFYCPPTLTFFIGLELYDFLQDLDFYDRDFVRCLENSKEKYNLDERIYLGLPISNDEYVSSSKILGYTRNY